MIATTPDETLRERIIDAIGAALDRDSGECAAQGCMHAVAYQDSGSVDWCACHYWPGEPEREAECAGQPGPIPPFTERAADAVLALLAEHPRTADPALFDYLSAKADEQEALVQEVADIIDDAPIDIHAGYLTAVRDPRRVAQDVLDAVARLAPAVEWEYGAGLNGPRGYRRRAGVPAIPAGDWEPCPEQGDDR